jgi:Domain of unknown function (DUF222)/HNH endonuclease
MESNMYSSDDVASVEPVGLDQLEAAVEQLACQDLTVLSEGVAAARVLALRRMVDRLEGHWLRELAAVDGRGAAGAEHDGLFVCTASWLRRRLRLSKGAAHQAVQTARALFRGPLTGTATALAAGELSAAHAGVLANGTADLPSQTTAEAEPVLLEAARQLDPPGLRRAVNHLRYVTDPETAEQQAQRRYERRGLWLSSTFAGMVAVDGLLEPEAGHTLLAALEPLARPTDAEDDRSGWQRNADALTELARRSLEGGRLPQTGGVRPQLLVTVDLGSLLGRHEAPGGELGWLGSLPAEACRRLACDGALTRVLVTRHPTHHTDSHLHTHDGHFPDGHSHGSHHDGGHAAINGGGWDGATGDPDWNGSLDGEGGGLAGRLRTAIRLLPPALGGAPTQPLEVGRTTRVVSPAQRNALIVRDGGCVFPGCGRPPSWCEAHHLRHWAHGGPTDLANLALLCWAHHRAVHEGGWHLRRDPDGRFTATPPDRHPTAV